MIPKVSSVHFFLLNFGSEIVKPQKYAFINKRFGLIKFKSVIIYFDN